MKLSLPALLVAAGLSLVGNTTAQTSENLAQPLPVRGPGAPATPPSEEELQELGTFTHLGKGTMASAVESLDHRYFEKFAKTGSVDHLMPRLIYGPGAKEAKIEGELMLSLYNMRAVDALALVATAAGCRLEPIPSPPEAAEDKKKSQRVVGYHVTLATNSIPALTSEARSVTQDVPLHSLTNITTLPHPLVKVVEPVVDTFVYSNTATPPGTSFPPGSFINGVPAPPPPGTVPMTSTALPSRPSAPSPTGQVVRIYPMAFFFRGDETDNQLLEKNVALKSLIEEMLKDTEEGTEERFSQLMHPATKVLVVKATAVQHEIIEQIMTSLKENQQAEAQRTGALPR